MSHESYELIITEKPRVSTRIAQALSTNSIKIGKYKKISYYEIERNGKKIIVAPAVGHLFTLKEKVGSHDYPIFDVEWTPSYEISSNAKFTKHYAEVLKNLAKNASTFVNACDYDIEGSLIGFNALKFLCGEQSLIKAKRMKFSTLTKEELTQAYESKTTLDTNMINAGIARHVLDWYWGVNTSRALSYAYKAVSGKYVTLSAGRVQTPTLKILDDREHEIKKFKPSQFWVLSAILLKENKSITAVHEINKFSEKQKAEQAYKNSQTKKATVLLIKEIKTKQKPPTPFNLGDLQAEAYRIFKYIPSRTQQIAQRLYEQGLISYPRTNSQKLPKGLDAKKVIENLQANSNYRKIATTLLKEKVLKANEGKKTDEAHPCIYPTGELPKKLNKKDFNLYDLIVKRFFATFGKPALRVTQTVKFQLNTEIFLAKGNRTLEENWHIFYKPYIKLEEIELPVLEKGETLQVKKVSLEEKETKPPSRYSPASIIREMEKLNIGTKATRATILQTLYDRNYISGVQIKVTDFGSMLIHTLVKYVPELTSADLTRKFEQGMEQIKAGKVTKEDLIEKAKETLLKIFSTFKQHQAEIGSDLVKQYRETERKQRTIGKCPKCKHDLIIRVSKATHKQFIGCSNYPKCNCSFPLPQDSFISVTGKLCKHDNLPLIEVTRKGRRKFTMCISAECKSKAEWNKLKSRKKGKK